MVAQTIHAVYAPSTKTGIFIRFLQVTSLFAILVLSAWMLTDIGNITDYIKDTCMDGDEDAYKESSVKHNIEFITIITGVIVGISALFVMAWFIGLFWHKGGHKKVSEKFNSAFPDSAGRS